MRKEFQIERNGKNFVLYAGLLDEAHSHGLKRIETELIQIPRPDNGNLAIVKAVVETDKGVFTGLGDASPQNVSRAMASHLIRMAETRAKARALRDAVNVGATALEELGSDEETGTSVVSSVLDDRPIGDQLFADFKAGLEKAQSKEDLQAIVAEIRNHLNLLSQEQSDELRQILNEKKSALGA